MLFRYKPKIDHIKIVSLKPTAGIDKTSIMVLPGVNEVTDKEWAAMLPNVKAEIASGEFEEIKKNGGGVERIAGLSPTEAATAIDGCMNPKTLEKWYAEETREEVRIRIVKRFETLGLEVPETIPAPKGDEGNKASESGEGNGGNEDLKSLKRSELVAIAEGLGVTGTAAMNKEELVAQIENARS